MKKRAKIGLVAVIVVLVAVVGVYSALKPLAVETVTAERGLWESSFTETGDALGRGDADIYSLHGGEIKAVSVTEGQTVKQGDTLIEFDRAPLETALKQMNDELAAVQGQRESALGSAAAGDMQLDAQAAAIRAQIEAVSSSVTAVEAALNSERLMLENLEKDLEDALLLYELGEISERDLKKTQDAADEQARAVSSSETALRSTRSQLSALNTQYASVLAAKGQGVGGLAKLYEAQISSIQTGIGELERQLADATVKAPIDGVAGALSAEKGAIVQPGAPLVTIHSGGMCDVECYVRVKDAYGVKIGDRTDVSIELRGSKPGFEGTVAEVGGSAADVISSLGITEKRVRVLISVSGEGWNVIKPGYGLDVKFIISSTPDAIFVPKTALLQTESGWAVWVIENGRAVARAVERGDESTAAVVIVSGLNAGDVVIRDAGLDGVKEGKRVASAK